MIEPLNLQRRKPETKRPDPRVCVGKASWKGKRKSGRNRPVKKGRAEHSCARVKDGAGANFLPHLGRVTLVAVLAAACVDGRMGRARVEACEIDKASVCVCVRAW